MFHVGFALLALLAPAVLSCGEVGRRAGILPDTWDDPLIHVHVVVFGEVSCAFTDFSNIPSTISLELGNRGSSPSDYRRLNSTSFKVPAGGKDFALSGDYSYDPRANCLPGKPRVNLRGHCGGKVVYDLKPVYQGDLGDKKHRLEVYNAGEVCGGRFCK
ncbi:hypothetical protein AAVH_26251 [Aphelenchoides avenae]|nr:hypothetical protein AAVH_26251 [Aphelenchus avenae]